MQVTSIKVRCPLDPARPTRLVIGNKKETHFLLAGEKGERITSFARIQGNHLHSRSHPEVETAFAVEAPRQEPWTLAASPGDRLLAGADPRAPRRGSSQAARGPA